MSYFLSYHRRLQKTFASWESTKALIISSLIYPLVSINFKFQWCDIPLFLRSSADHKMDTRNNLDVPQISH